MWQLESGFQIDQNVGPGLGARNSKVGLQGAWGEVFLGQWDTPVQVHLAADQPDARRLRVRLHARSWATRAWAFPRPRRNSRASDAKPDAAFDRRVGNSVQYWSPTLGGFTARLAYSVDEGRDRSSATTPGHRAGDLVGARSSTTSAASACATPTSSTTTTSACVAARRGSAPARPPTRARRTTPTRSSPSGASATRASPARSSSCATSNNDSVAGAISEYKRNAWYVIVEQRFGDNAQRLGAPTAKRERRLVQPRRGALACSTPTAMGAKY